MSVKEQTSAQCARKRILHVDDHPMIRSGLAQMINQQSDLVICGEASDAREAMNCIASLKPDLAVVDISMEGKSGLELIKDMQSMHPDLPVLVLSMHDESLYAERALRAGARGYVMKKSGGDVVLHAIRHVLLGKTYVSEPMSAQIVNRFAGTRTMKHSSPIEMLTDREFEVFKLIGEGCTTREVGTRLHISSKTVDVYRQQLKKKLALSSSTSLIQHAVRWVETQSRH